MITLCIIASFFVIFLVWSLVYNISERTKLINKIPGPKRHFFFGNALNPLFRSPADMFDHVVSFYTKYRSSPLFRLWIFHLPFVFVTNAEGAEVILSSTTEINKSDFYEFLKPWLGLGLLTSNGQKWRKHRKLLTPSFHFGILENFVPIFNEQSETLVSRLMVAVNKNSTLKDVGFDVSPLLFLCTLDIICETAMGCKIHAQTNSETEYVKAMHEMGIISFDHIWKPWLQVPWIFNLTSYKKRQIKCLDILHSFSRKVIKEKKEHRKRVLYETDYVNSPMNETNDGVYGQKRRKAFLDTLLDALDDNGFGLTEEEIREEVDTFVFEGLDTTAAGLTWALFSLGCHPEVQELVHEELDRVFGSEMRHVTLQDLKELKYLEAVFKETLRLFPSVPLFSRSLIQDMEIGDYKLLKGTQLVISPHAIQRDPKYYPQPDHFDPKRFLDKHSGRNPYAYIPFSAGPRNCIGQKFAMIEEKIILAHILKNFSISCEHKFNEMRFIDALVMLPASGMKLTVCKRTAGHILSLTPED